MNHQAPTPAEAIEKLKRFHAIDVDHKEGGRLSGGVYYARTQHLAHPLRRFAACYIKGQDQDLVASRCDLIDGILVLKTEFE